MGAGYVEDLAYVFVCCCCCVWVAVEEDERLLVAMADREGGRRGRCRRKTASVATAVANDGRMALKLFFFLSFFPL